MRRLLHRAAVRVADYAWVVRAQHHAAGLDEPAWREGHGVPVLLLPGVYEPWGVMVGLGRALHRAGHPVHVVPALGSNTGDLAAAAAAVARRLIELGLDDVVLVAHSKGGLIGALVMADPVVGGRVRRLVTINTPFAGSSLAWLFPTRAVWGLRPSAPQVAAAARSLDPARVAALAAPFDPHVPGTHLLAGAINVVLPLDGHFRVLGGPEGPRPGPGAGAGGAVGAGRGGLTRIFR